MPKLYQPRELFASPIKAITLYPIWAWLIIYGPKRVENRTWATTHRGPLAIHAGSTRKTEREDRIWLAARGMYVPHNLPVGAILGVVNLDDCLLYGDDFADDPFACGPYCWMLSKPNPLEHPIYVPGKLSLWNFDAEQKGSLPSASVFPLFPTA